MIQLVSSSGKNLQAANTPSAGDASDEIRGRYSEEIVIALSGPVGCGINHVRDLLSEQLRVHNYSVVDVKISDAFAELAARLEIINPTIGAKGEFERITKFQDLGNSLREKIGDDLGAQIALNVIAQDRIERNSAQNVPVEDIKPGRVAYIISQLKNPKEASLLRDVYGNLFYLIGVLSGYDRRKDNLTKSMSSIQAEQLMERDRSESGNGGQQLEKTLKNADFFVRNSHDNIADLRGPIERFVNLVHGKNGITPTLHERGMYAAFSAGLRSACLSRQVGAAIADAYGNVIGTGCNDVPKAGGGLYEPGPGDHRCVFRDGGLCQNDKHKDKLRNEIEEILRNEGVEAESAKAIAVKIRKETRLKDLIEFSRAVHAEMDALIGVARRGGNGLRDCSLFSTTYPCHNCARHIVAAGIKVVYFIEPYEKSLAGQLHSDSIVHDKFEAERVSFMHFEGVAPSRFSALFSAIESRKDANGSAKPFSAQTAEQKAPEVLDNYRQLEAKIAQRLQSICSDGKANPKPA